MARSRSNLHHSLATSTCVASGNDKSLSMTTPTATAAAVAAAAAVIDNRHPTYLVVGDGDFSFSAHLARQLVNDHSDDDTIQLIATVFEDEITHRTVYRNSEWHTQTILAAGESSSSSPFTQVRFGVDATQLARHFGHDGSSSSKTTGSSEQTTTLLFDRIIFNFPHWRGKANIRYNRELLNKFLQSACQVLKKPNPTATTAKEQKRSGEIHVTLCHGQGGTEASSVREWRQSWMASMFAAEHGLLLKQLQTFTVEYDLSSHRGADRAFSVGTNEPLTYVFGFPCDSGAIDRHLQVACRHELRLELPLDLSKDHDNNNKDDEKESACNNHYPYSTEELINGNLIPEMVQQVVAQFPGIRAETPLRDLITTARSGRPLLVFLIVYAGEAKPLTRSEADRIRETLEQTAMDALGLNIAKKDRMVSKPFPYPLLNTLIEEYSTNTTN